MSVNLPGKKTMSDLEHHPFIMWFAYMYKKRTVDPRGKDIIVDAIGSKRFGLDVDKTTSKALPVLCVGIYDVKPINSINWTSAGIIIGQKNKDWVALSCPDVRIQGSQEPKPVPLRLWIQFPTGSLDAFAKNGSDKLYLKSVKLGKGDSPIVEKAPFDILPLKVKDFWKR
jgi:hypothetical protein